MKSKKWLFSALCSQQKSRRTSLENGNEVSLFLKVLLLCARIALSSSRHLTQLLIMSKIRNFNSIRTQISVKIDFGPPFLRINCFPFALIWNFFISASFFHTFFWHCFFRAAWTDPDRLGSSASHSDSLIWLSFSMAVFSTNSVRLFFIATEICTSYFARTRCIYIILGRNRKIN